MNFYQRSSTETNEPPSLQIFSSNNSQKNRKKAIKVDFDILSNMDRMKFIDSSINKFYSKYLQKQAFIQHDQKIYDILEKLDEPKVFNSLRANYIREQNELKNMNNIIKDKRKVTDNISSVNLSNCQKKLYSIYKLSGDDLGFMTSFMHHLGNRPQKIVKQKVNKKLEALSMGKLGNFLRKKDKNKNEKNLKSMNNSRNNKNYLKILLKKIENENLNSIKDNNNNYNINDDNNNDKNNKFNSNDSIEENKIIENTNTKGEINRKISFENNQRKIFLKKNTMNMTPKNIRLFRNAEINNANMTNYSSKYKVNDIKKYSVNYNDLYMKYKAKSREESLNDEKKEEKKIEIYDNTNYKRQNSKFNNIVTTTNTYNTFTNFRDSIINKVNINQNNEKEKEEEENLVNINIEDSSSNDVEDDKNKEKGNEKILKNSKKINNNEEKKRILKMYKTSMNDFLQKVKQEGNILNRTSNRLSSLLHKLKNENFETFQNERNKNKNQILNQENYKTVYNQNRTQENLMDKKKGRRKMGKTFYNGAEKSRYRIPYINKVVYGENNLYDPFEKLQKDLFFEVKNQLKNAELINKKKKKKVVNVVGIDILRKLIREDSDDEMKKELFELNNNQSKNNNSSTNKNKNKSSGKNNEINKGNNKKSS